MIKKSAFTVVELLVVVLLTSIISAVAVPSYKNRGTEAQIAAKIARNKIICDKAIADCYKNGYDVCSCAGPASLVAGTDADDRLLPIDNPDFDNRDLLIPKAGNVDIMIGGSGADTFQFGAELSDNIRSYRYALDFSSEDHLRFIGHGVTDVYEIFGRTYLVTAPDGDIILLFNYIGFLD